MPDDEKYRFKSIENDIQELRSDMKQSISDISELKQESGIMRVNYSHLESLLGNYSEDIKEDRKTRKHQNWALWLLLIGAAVSILLPWIIPKKASSDELNHKLDKIEKKIETIETQMNGN